MHIFFPEIANVSTIYTLNFSQYGHIFCFSLKRNQYYMEQKNLNDTKSLILIGPEGGFSASEEMALSQHSCLSFLNIPSYILRSSTAMSVALGQVLAHYK